MPPVASIFRVTDQVDGLAAEVLSVLIGVGFTLGLFVSLSQLDSGSPAELPEPIEDLRALSIPLEPPPPPRPVETVAPLEPVPGVVGLELGASDSPVKIAVVPPDLEALFPPAEHAPRAEIGVGKLYTELKPRAEVAPEFSRIYQAAEVDRLPTVAYRAAPRISKLVRQGAERLRVTLLIIVDQKGSVVNVRVMSPSGNLEFDRIVADCVKDEWLFTPAIKAGKAVRCLLQQPVSVVWSGGSPFEL